MPQLRMLAQAVQAMQEPKEARELTQRDLIALGFSSASAARIVELLSQTQQLRWYTSRGAQSGCTPLTRVSMDYPPLLRRRLALDAPCCLWARGDIALLKTPAVALVGSRALRPENLEFAAEAGKQAALQGLTLVSGNARGADRQAQESCLAHGGSVISVVADSLCEQPLRERVLYLAEDGYDLAFSPQRALSRNRIIHCLGMLTLVAQCTLGKGGTWDGTCKNLRQGWGGVYCFDDASEAVLALEELGARPIALSALSDISALQNDRISFL